MKKSFSLFITIILLTLFSYLILSIFQTKAFRSKNIQNQYLYIQAKNHSRFLKEYLNKIDLSTINHIEIKDRIFNISATIKKEPIFYKITTYVSAKEYDIRVIDKFVK